MTDRHNDDSGMEARLPGIHDISSKAGASSEAPLGYREAMAAASSPKPVSSSVRAKENASRSATAPVGSKRSTWPIPQSQGINIPAPLNYQNNSRPRPKLGSAGTQGSGMGMPHNRAPMVYHESQQGMVAGGMKAFSWTHDEEGNAIPIQHGVAVVDSFSQDILEGPMAIRIMQKLRQVEEYMRNKPGGGGSCGPGLSGAQASMLDTMNKRIVLLESQLAASENARNAAQARTEKLFAKMEKTVTDARMDFEGDGGIGRKQLKETAEKSAAAVGAAEKIKTSVSAIERRLAELESCSTKQNKKTQDELDGRLTTAVAELEELGSKVHQLDMVVQQWTRGYNSGSGGSTSKPARASKQDKPATPTSGAPPMVVALEERLAKVEESVVLLESKVVELTSAYESNQEEIAKELEALKTTSKNLAPKAELEALSHRMAESTSTAAAILEELKDNLDANKSGASSLGEQVAALAGDLEANKNSVSSLGEQVAALAGDLDTNKNCVSSLGEQVAALAGDLDANKSGASSLGEHVAALAGDHNDSKNIVSSLGEQVAALAGDLDANKNSVSSLGEQVAALAGDLDANKNSVGSLIEQVAALASSNKPAADNDASVPSISLAKAEVEGMVKEAKAASADLVLDLRNKVMPLFDELVKRLKILEAKPTADPSAAITPVANPAAEAEVQSLTQKVKDLEDSLAMFTKVEAHAALLMKVEALEAMLATQLQIAPVPADADGGGGSEAVSARMEELNAAMDCRVTQLQTKITNLLQVMVGRVKALEAGQPPSSVPAASGTATLDSINLDLPENVVAPAEANVSGVDSVLADAAAIDLRLRAIEARVGKADEPFTDVVGMEAVNAKLAKLEALEPKLMDVEGTMFEKLETLQQKVTSVMQLMIQRLKNLEAVVHGAGATAAVG